MFCLKLNSSNYCIFLRNHIKIFFKKLHTDHDKKFSKGSFEIPNKMSDEHISVTFHAEVVLLFDRCSPCYLDGKNWK